MLKKRNLVNRVKLVAVGDVLIHKNVYKKAYTRGTYDFESFLSSAVSLLKKGDLTFANQESLIAGKKIGISGYPNFNSPVEIGYFLKEAGVNIVNLANNHVFDRGEEGILHSISNWEKIGIPYVGAHKSLKDKSDVRIIEVHGIRFSFVAYTDGMKLKKLPENKQHLVNTIKGPGANRTLKKRLKNIKEDIEAARNVSDVVVVSLHFGEEYHRLPNGLQKEIAYSVSDYGADIIIGHHPHVLQPPEWVINSKGKKTFVAYSLGNFFSGQRGLYRQVGGLLYLNIENKPIDGINRIKIDEPSIQLTYVDTTDKKDFKLHLLESIVKERTFLKCVDKEVFNSHEVYEDIKRHMRLFMPKLKVY